MRSLLTAFEESIIFGPCRGCCLDSDHCRTKVIQTIEMGEERHNKTSLTTATAAISKPSGNVSAKVCGCLAIHRTLPVQPSELHAHCITFGQLSTHHSALIVDCVGQCRDLEVGLHARLDEIQPGISLPSTQK